jgi:CPA2 family monovalent cation:H+ antiporter-2
LNGRNVSRVLRETAIPFVVLELDVDQVRLARDEGVPVLYGDATRAEILERCGVRSANVLVLGDLGSRSDAPSGSRRTPAASRRAHSGRTRAVSEIDSLRGWAPTR